MKKLIVAKNSKLNKKKLHKFLKALRFVIITILEFYNLILLSK